MSTDYLDYGRLAYLITAIAKAVHPLAAPGTHAETCGGRAELEEQNRSMAKLSRAKLDILKNAFMAEGKTPGQAAKDAGTSYATAKRYYELWDEEIKKGLENALIPQLEQSVGRMKPASGAGHVRREEKRKPKK